eukprot:1158274-Pelagomonas_calceolata.AAC.36
MWRRECGRLGSRTSRPTCLPQTTSSPKSWCRLWTLSGDCPAGHVLSLVSVMYKGPGALFQSGNPGSWCPLTTWLLQTIVSNGKPILLVGESGTAKSVTITKYLGSLDPGVNLVLNMNFSSRTSSLDVQVGAGGTAEDLH